MTENKDHAHSTNIEPNVKHESHKSYGKINPQRIKKCIVCGKEFVCDTQHVSIAKYCSIECRSKNTKRQNTESLEDVEKLVRYLVTKMNKASSVNVYSPVFYTDVLNPTDSQRIAVAKRDKNRCRVCNSRSNLEIHHIVKRRDGGGNDMDNLITLCNKCHRHIETGDIENAIKKCTRNYLCVANKDSSVFAFHLNNLEKVEYSKAELAKLYNIIADSGDYVNTESIKICLDEILDRLE